LIIKISSFIIAASKEHDSLEADRDYLEGDALGIIIAGRYVLPKTKKN